jgi:3'(2'), 5'-bisphosphate nucleotidase
MGIYQSGEFATEMKHNKHPVTFADKVSHSIITKILCQTSLLILSEEGINIDFNERRRWEYFWLIDPLDGTKIRRKSIKVYGGL